MVDGGAPFIPIEQLATLCFGQVHGRRRLRRDGDGVSPGARSRRRGRDHGARLFRHDRAEQHQACDDAVDLFGREPRRDGQRGARGRAVDARQHEGLHGTDRQIANVDAADERQLAVERVVANRLTADHRSSPVWIAAQPPTRSPPRHNRQIHDLRAKEAHRHDRSGCRNLGLPRRNLAATLARRNTEKRARAPHDLTNSLLFSGASAARPDGSCALRAVSR